MLILHIVVVAWIAATASVATDDLLVTNTEMFLTCAAVSVVVDRPEDLGNYRRYLRGPIPTWAIPDAKCERRLDLQITVGGITTAEVAYDVDFPPLDDLLTTCLDKTK